MSYFKPVPGILAALVLLAGCKLTVTTPPQSSPTPTPPGGLKWYTTCGDPVCGNPNATPVPNTCGNNKEGQSCSVEGATCDLGNECHQKLICAKSDPKLQPGGCPISKPVWKQDIRFLGPVDRAALARQVQDLRLASWHYRFDPKGPERLGFMIDEATPPSLVKPDGNSVDLYGYMSMAVAALQDQQEHVRSLESRLARLEAELDRCGQMRR
ncbi:MAG: hypothetical protein ACAI44_04050 [Candidatus Sericytochromatia bacterium]